MEEWGRGEVRAGAVHGAGTDPGAGGAGRSGGWPGDSSRHVLQAPLVPLLPPSSARTLVPICMYAWRLSKGKDGARDAWGPPAPSRLWTGSPWSAGQPSGSGHCCPAPCCSPAPSPPGQGQPEGSLCLPPRRTGPGTGAPPKGHPATLKGWWRGKRRGNEELTKTWCEHVICLRLLQPLTL